MIDYVKRPRIDYVKRPRGDFDCCVSSIGAGRCGHLNNGPAVVDHVRRDGEEYVVIEVPAGEPVRLRAGDSVVLGSRLIHRKVR